MKNLPEISHFEEKNYDNPVIYWSHYDMVQTELILIAKSFPYDHNKEAIIRLFNEYFGGGMNSIVFQEIREAQGLAYSVFSNFRQPNKKEFSNYLTSYIGIQSDKQEEAISSMFDLINKLPESKQAFEIAKMAILNKIESERISKSSVIYAYFRATDKGLNHDIRKDIYEAVKKFSFSDLLEFHKDYIKNIQQNIVLIGNREKIDFENLSKYGKLIELSHEELFAY
jgi:predicted Zn-dependent peptidase